MKTWEKIAGTTWLVTMFLICMILLVGCSNPHKNEHCVSSHRELWYIQHTKVMSGVYISQPVYHNVCDKWVANT